MSYNTESCVHYSDAATIPAPSYEYNRDEINQVAVNRKGTFLAAADDSGEVKIVDLATNSVFKTLRGVHKNICSGVQFHPKKIWEVATGGLDAK
jgi:WD40 repeat protein